MTLGRLREDSGGIGDVAERAVAVVVKQIVALALRAGGRVAEVRLDVYVEPAVAVVVDEVTHAARVDDGESALGRLVLERAVALVDVELVWRVEPADVKVEQTVVVHVDERGALFPLAAVVLDACRGRHVLEVPVAEIPEEAARLDLADDEDVGLAVIVVVADGHTRADRADVVFAVAFRPHARIVVAIRGDHAGALGR